MIKTYLVPITEKLIKAMEKGEAPSFLHCATCLDGLTNGEVMKRMFPDAKVYQSGGYTNMTFKGGTFFEDRESDWWNRKWVSEHDTMEI